MSFNKEKTLKWIKKHKKHIALAVTVILFLLFFSVMTYILFLFHIELQKQDNQGESKIKILDAYEFVVPAVWGVLAFAGGLVGTYMISKREKTWGLQEKAYEKMSNCINANKLKFEGYIPLPRDENNLSYPEDIRSLLGENKIDLVLKVTEINGNTIFPNEYEVDKLEITSSTFSANQQLFVGNIYNNNRQILICFIESECSQRNRQILFDFILDAFYFNREKKKRTAIALNFKIHYSNPNQPNVNLGYYTHHFNIKPSSGIDETRRFELSVE